MRAIFPYDFDRVPNRFAERLWSVGEDSLGWFPFADPLPRTTALFQRVLLGIAGELFDRADQIQEEDDHGIEDDCSNPLPSVLIGHHRDGLLRIWEWCLDGSSLQDVVVDGLPLAKGDAIRKSNLNSRGTTMWSPGY